MTPCKEHTQKGNARGYGTGYRGNKYHGLHRLALADKLGVGIESLRGLVARHTCDNPRCVNPDHLVEGTQKDNIGDAVQRGRLVARTTGIDDSVLLPYLQAYIPRHPEHGRNAVARKLGISANAVQLAWDRLRA